MPIGLIGVGLMGLAMSQRLLEQDQPLIVYNRTLEKLTPLQGTAAMIADTPQAVLEQCDRIILMLTDADAIAEVVLTHAADSLLRDRTLIQMGTIAPSESCAIRDQVVSAGGNYLEAPVLGSLPEARSGELLVMVGSTPEQFQTGLPLLQMLGPEPRLMGPVGTASATKLALNQLIGSLTTAFALSLGFIQHHQVDSEPFMQILRQSALYAPTFDKKLSRMLEQNYINPNFSTKHLLKDMRLFTQAAQQAGLTTHSTEAIQQVLEIAVARSFAEMDYSALFSAILPQQ
jgi:3-hydroxyisobutyrate dehydrogenase